MQGTLSTSGLLTERLMRLSLIPHRRTLAVQHCRECDEEDFRLTANPDQTKCVRIAHVSHVYQDSVSDACRVGDAA